MPDAEAVLFANEVFYRAFADKDLAAMEDLWSDGARVSCIHPGWGPIHGRDEVMETWAAIIENPDSPAILCRAAEASVYGEVAFVICYEQFGGDFLIATNVFVREGHVWKMVHHQAGPTSATPPEEEAGEGLVN